MAEETIHRIYTYKYIFSVCTTKEQSFSKGLDSLIFVYSFYNQIWRKMNEVLESDCIFRLFGNHTGFHNALVTVQRKCLPHWVRWWVGCDPWYVALCSVPSGTVASAQASYSSIAHCCHYCFCTRSSSDNSRISFLRRGRFTQRYVHFTDQCFP